MQAVRHHVTPEVAHWYQDTEFKSIFEIVNLDEEDGSMVIQYFAGELEELDFDTWGQMYITAIPEPSDWTGPFEIEEEDLSYAKMLHSDEWISHYENPEDTSLDTEYFEEEEKE